MLAKRRNDKVKGRTINLINSTNLKKNTRYQGVLVGVKCLNGEVSIANPAILLIHNARVQEMLKLIIDVRQNLKLTKEIKLSRQRKIKILMISFNEVLFE